MGPLRRLGFLTIGLFDPADPAAGHEETLRVIELGEDLGFDSAWLRHRHLQHGISSPVAVMAAASQRTSRIHLGTAVTPLGAENPFRLAEDLATVDALSHGRINPGFSVGPPMNYDRYKAALYPDTADHEDLSYNRLERLLAYVSGEPVSDLEGTVGIETFSRTIQPQSPGLRDRIWYGGGSLGSCEWAGKRGLNLLTSSVVKAEGSTDDFVTIQRRQIDAFRSAHPAGATARVSQGLVVIPTDSAAPSQAAKYEAYAAARLPRTRDPQGPAGLLFAPTSSAHRSGSPKRSMRTRVSRPSTRWPSLFRSRSITRTTSRSSPTSPSTSAPCSAGRPTVELPGLVGGWLADSPAGRGNGYLWAVQTAHK